jgi:hypothetical protein
MQRISITRIEFFGGPEDGRVLDADLFYQLAGGESADFDRIAMLARDESLPGDVYHVIGTYVASEMKGKTLLYLWVAIVA